MPTHLHNLVHAVQELGPEVSAHHLHDRRFGLCAVAALQQDVGTLRLKRTDDCKSAVYWKKLQFSRTLAPCRLDKLKACQAMHAVSCRAVQEYGNQAPPSLPLLHTPGWRS